MWAPDPMDLAIPVFAQMIFGLIVLVILGTMLSGILRWIKNNHSPLIRERAKVVNMRNSVRGNGGSHAASTLYYMTFELESGVRVELRLSGQEYGQLAMGDSGALSYQGTRYLGFERE